MFTYLERVPRGAEVLEGVQGSKVFKIPNPWTTAVMSLLSEIHDVPNLRTNLMFEVEVRRGPARN